MFILFDVASNYIIDRKCLSRVSMHVYIKHMMINEKYRVYRVVAVFDNRKVSLY